MSVGLSAMSADRLVLVMMDIQQHCLVWCISTACFCYALERVCIALELFSTYTVEIVYLALWELPTILSLPSLHCLYMFHPNQDHQVHRFLWWRTLLLTVMLFCFPCVIVSDYSKSCGLTCCFYECVCHMVFFGLLVYLWSGVLLSYEAMKLRLCNFF
jgi:hypothetical protein